MKPNGEFEWTDFECIPHCSFSQYTKEKIAERANLVLPVWRPIGTCPSKNDEEMFDVWATSRKTGKSSRFTDCGRTKNGIFFGPFLTEEWEPTHWAPLPVGPRE